MSTPRYSSSPASPDPQTTIATGIHTRTLTKLSKKSTATSGNDHKKPLRVRPSTCVPPPLPRVHTRTQPPLSVNPGRGSSELASTELASKHTIKSSHSLKAVHIGHCILKKIFTKNCICSVYINHAVCRPTCTNLFTCLHDATEIEMAAAQGQPNRT